MKNLRQLIRRYRNNSSDQSHRATRNGQSGRRQRRLTTEALERRELLAAGVLEMHNPWNQFDVNNDRTISARDALGVINYLGRGESEQASDDGNRMFYDVNGDNEITAADALGVINAIGRGEGMEDPLIELLLTARQPRVAPGGEADDFDLDLIPVDGTGAITVEVGQIFDIEVSYEDLRFENDRLGAFQLIVDLVTNSADVIRPVLLETQQLVVDAAIKDLSLTERLNTTYTLTIPNSPPGVSGATTYTSPNANSITIGGAIREALTAFGYTDDQYYLSTPAGTGADDIGVQINWTDLDLADLDLPDITIEVNESAGVDDIVTTQTHIDPFIDVGGQQQFNPDAIPFNLNTFSRTFKQSSENPFGEQFYNSNNAGQFDPATGFSAVKGIGGIPSQGGGIPQLIPALEYPAGDFDAFAFSVVIEQPVSNFRIDLLPNADDGENTEAILIYGEDNRVPINNQSVIIERPGDVDLLGNGNASLIINAIDPNAANPPVAADGAIPAFDEGSTGSIDLSTLLTGGAFDTLAITTQGTRGSASISGTQLTYTPNDADEFGSDTVSYTATNGDGSSSGTISVTIDPVNDAPVAVDDEGPFQVVSGTPITLTHAQLTDNDDPGAANESADPLTAIPDGAASANGGTISAVAGGIQYSAPGGGFTGTDTFTYRVNDGSVDSANTATVTVNVTAQPVDPPVAADGSIPAFDEGSTGSIDLATLLAGGAVDTLTVSTQGTRGTASISGTQLTYTPNDTDEFGSDTIVYTATNTGGSDTGTIAITINPVNDAPVAVDDEGPFQVVSGTPITLTHAQLTDNDDPGAANESADPLTAIPVGAASANGGTIIAVAGGIQYSAPGGGFTGTDTFTYRVNDGSVDSANTATVTVNVSAQPVDPPTAADGSIPAFDEGSTGSIDLATLLAGGAVDTLTVTTQGTRGTASISGTQLTYTPNDADEFGSDTIVYTATNTGGSDTGTISITINPVNDAPVADNETLTTPENTPLTIQLSTLLDGDIVGPANEIPRDTLSIQIVNDPTNPLASLDQNGVLTYNPPPDFFGSDSFTYVITDGSPDGALTDTGTVTIEITEGPNNIPEVDGPLSESFSEDDAPATITEAGLLFGASDPDDDDLVVRNLTRVSGLAAGISIVGSSLSVTPGANGSLTDGQSVSAVYSYEIYDGEAAVDQTMTITINGENDPPVTGPVDDIVTFTGSDPVIIDVLAEADAGSGEDEPLSIVSASLSNPAAGTVSFNGTIVYTLDPDFEGDVTVNYEISDGKASDTGSVNVSVLDFDPSLIDGYVFIDRMENALDVALNDATPYRDGDKDENEQGLGGIPVYLSNGDMTWTAITDLDGHFEFQNVAPGSYTVTYDPIPEAIYVPVVPMSIEIGPAGGESVEANVPLLGLSAVATSAHDILGRTYLPPAIVVAARAASADGQEGLFASLDSDGKSNFVMAQGFDDVKYADVRTIDDAGNDAALLTLLKENGDVVSAIVTEEDGNIGIEGGFVRLFGGINDFSFATYDEDVSDVEGFRAAIDEILGDIE